MSCSHRNSRLAAVSAFVALVGVLILSPTHADAQTAPVRPLEVERIDGSAYPNVTATVTVGSPIGGTRLPASAFSVSSGGADVPVSVRNHTLRDLSILLVVDPGPDSVAARSVRGVATELVDRLMPEAAVTLIAGRPDPAVVVPSTRNDQLVRVALTKLPDGPSGALDATDLALAQPIPDPVDTLVFLITASSPAASPQAAQIAKKAASAQVPVNILLPGLDSVPPAFEPFGAEGGANLQALPTILAAFSTLDRLQTSLDTRYVISFQVPADRRSSPDLTVAVTGAGAAGKRPLPLDVPAGSEAPVPTTAGDGSTPSTVASGQPEQTPNSSRDSTSFPWLIVLLGVAALAVGAAGVMVLRRRQVRRPDPIPSVDAGSASASPPLDSWADVPAVAGNDTAGITPEPVSAVGPGPTQDSAEPVGGDGPAHTDVPGPLSPPEVTYPLTAPTVPALGRNRGDGRPASTGGPATGVRRWDRADPQPVTSDPVARNRPGAHWWMYQRPDTGHQPASSSSGGSRNSNNDSDDPEPAGHDTDTPVVQRTRTVPGNPPTTPLVVGGFLILLAAVLGRWVTAGQGPRLLLVGAIFLAVGFGRILHQRHPEDGWLPRYLVWGVTAKLVFCYVRYFVIISGIEEAGDSAGYDGYGRALAAFWKGEGPNQQLADLRQTNFVRWFTGVVYYIFGSNYLNGFIVYGLIAVIGSYLWYRATVDAVPFIDRRLYLALVLFVPSIVYWPAVIGKEALMQFGLGLVALGVSRLMTARVFKGLLISTAGGWLLWAVRPHLLALVAIGGGVGYLVGRVRPKEGGKTSLLGRPIGIIAVAVLVTFTVNQGAEFLGLKDLSLTSIEDRLNEQTDLTTQGGSKFQSSGNSLNPLKLPIGAATVLLRPFPWETDSPIQLLASAEGALFAIFIGLRLRSLRVALSQSRVQPYLMFCWVFTILYCMAFSSFSNFGLLVRQRSLVLPAVFVLLSVDPRRASRSGSAEPDSGRRAVAGARPRVQDRNSTSIRR